MTTNTVAARSNKNSKGIEYLITCTWDVKYANTKKGEVR